MTVVDHHSAEELQTLFQREREARLAKRIWIVWQARLGQTAPEIAQGIGMSRRAVQEWVRRYNTDGLAGLQTRSGQGREPLLSEEERQAVAKRLEEGPQAGDVCSLRGLDFQRFLEDQFGKLLSLSTVYGLLHDLGFEWLVPRSKHRKSDPEAVAAFQKKFPKNWLAFRPSIPIDKSSSSFRMSAASASKER
ncbi:MAG: winged helix-turn-helix domain-containing protein [Planctomycetaceae bacterium]|nr:winged helix-turn-helix domain-containing protein [Planctomycetaceae bacterium]